MVQDSSFDFRLRRNYGGGGGGAHRENFTEAEEIWLQVQWTSTQQLRISDLAYSKKN